MHTYYQLSIVVELLLLVGVCIRQEYYELVEYSYCTLD